jgi:hypothetical protein
MGINARLETEAGEALEELLDPGMLLSRLVQRNEFGSTTCLRFLDPWGDTTFNHSQIPFLIVELDALREQVDAATRTHIAALIALAARVDETPHLYLKFIGD